MSAFRRQIVLDFAKWTALSALRSGSPIKSREHVYPLLDAVSFATVLETASFISQEEFDVWHEQETLALCSRNSRTPVGWGAKLINVYLKTAAYVGNLGRPNLHAVIHPPIDSGLWNGIAKCFKGQPDIVADACCVKRIREIKDYEIYRRIIRGCRSAANTLKCSLIEVEQLWTGSATPTSLSGDV